MLFLVLKKVQMIKITPPQVHATTIKKFPQQNFPFPHPLTLFGKPCHAPNFDVYPMFSTHIANPAQIIS